METSTPTPSPDAPRTFRLFLFIFLGLILLAPTLTGCQTAISPEPPPATPSPAPAGNNFSLTWTRTLSGPINHPPLVVGDILIVAPVHQPLTALHAETGEIAWEFDPGAEVWDRAYATDGKQVFVGIEGGKLVSLDGQTGKTLWKADLGINTHIPAFVTDDAIYVSTTFVGGGLVGNPDGKAKLFALSPADGHTLWAFESDNYILQSPYRQGDTIYAAGSYKSDVAVDEGGAMRLYALNAADGSVKWAHETLDGYPKQLYATDDAIAYIAYRDFTIGLDANTGNLSWQNDTGNWVPTLSGADGMIYYGSANTVVHAEDVSTGEKVWQFNIPEGTFNYVLGAPVRAGDELVFLTQQGDVFGLDAATGEMRWHFATGIVGARVGLTVANGWVFFGDAEGVVYGYGEN